MGLEWRTLEEEDRSRRQAPAVETPAPKRRGRRWWSLSFLALLLMAAVTWGVRYVLQTRMEAITALVEAEVLAVHGSVQQAEYERDEALLGSIISSDYPNWGGSQKRMLGRGARWDRAFLGLSLVRGENDKPPTGAVTEIAFTSDWNMATVTLAFPYQQADGPPVTLHQTVTYREEPTGWALVPAYPAFWGENRTFTGRYLTVAYPERDAAVAERLARDWDASLAAACEALDDLPCGRTWKLKVELSTESGALAPFAQGVSPGQERWGTFDRPPRTGGGSGSGLTLPAPSIIGQPQDEIGYQALRAGYAPLVVGAGIAEIAGWRCCSRNQRAPLWQRRGAVFSRALVDKQLSQLGLAPWPVTASGYEEILQGPTLDILDLHWVYLQRSTNNIPPHLWKIVYSMVDFILAAHPQQSPAALQRALIQYDTYRQWLLNAGFNSFGSSIQKEWIRFADQQLARDTAAAASMPAQDLQLLCTEERFQEAGVYRYDLQSGAFVEEGINDPFRLIYPLPNRDGVLLQRPGGRPNAGSDSLVQILRQGQMQGVAYETTHIPLSAIGNVSDGMLFYAYSSRQPGLRYAYLDLVACDSGACAIRFLDGFPAWSPMSDKTIVSRGDGVLWLGNEKGEPQMAIAHGHSVAWLDNERFVYIQPDDGMRVEAMSLPRLELETLLEIEGLAGALGSVTDDTQITLTALAAHPAMPDRLVVAAHVENRMRRAATHIFAHNLASGEITELLQVEHPLEPIRSLRFSPDGRWLFVHSIERSAADWHLHLYNSQTEESLTFSSGSALAFPGYDLSADGAWLVRVDEGFIHLVPLHGGRQRLVAHDFDPCYAAVWVDKPTQ